MQEKRLRQEERERERERKRERGWLKRGKVNISKRNGGFNMHKNRIPLTLTGHFLTRLPPAKTCLALVELDKKEIQYITKKQLLFYPDGCHSS